MKTDDSVISSTINYDTERGEFLEQPDGISILGLSADEENDFKEKLNEIYLTLLLSGYVSLIEKKL